MKILIKNVNIIDKFTDIKGSILIEDDKIIKVCEGDIKDDCDDIIDGFGRVLMPGFIDTHAHFRDPGYTAKEDLYTGSMAAINGGYTYVNLMANTKPICDNQEVLDLVNTKAKDINLIGINQVVAVTKNLLGKEFIDMKNITADILSDDGKDLLSNDMMYKACMEANKYNKTIMVHAEDSQISPYDYRVAEDVITMRDVYLSGKTGCHIHLSHVSTRDAVDYIRNGKAKGYNVTCEVTPHHISMYDVNYRVNPPIREKEDVAAMIEGIKDGTVDAIGTDHAPHTLEDKEKGAPGMVGIETAFSVCYTALVAGGHIDMKKLSDIMSYAGADILRLKKRGLIREGYYADLVLVDVNEEIVVDKSQFKSKSCNTPYLGKKLKGSVKMTIRNGRILKNDNR